MRLEVTCVSTGCPPEDFKNGHPKLWQGQANAIPSRTGPPVKSANLDPVWHIGGREVHLGAFLPAVGVMPEGVLVALAAREVDEAEHSRGRAPLLERDTDEEVGAGGGGGARGRPRARPAPPSHTKH